MGDRNRLVIIRGFCLACVDFVGNLTASGCRRDAMFLVIRHLFGTATLGFFNRLLHTWGNAVSVQNRLTIDMARGTTDGLNERTLRA